MERHSFIFNATEISFIHKPGNGFPLIFVHGNSLNAELFAPLIKSTTLSGLDIYAIDLPGHGNSGKLVNGYSFQNVFDAIPALIQHLKLREYAIFAHSFGGHLILQHLEQLKGLKGLIISGTPPLTDNAAMAAAFLPNPAAQLAFTPNLSNEQMTQLAEIVGNKNNTDQIKQAIEQSDPNFRAGLIHQISTQAIHNEVEKLNSWAKPVCLLQATKDQAVNLSYIQNLDIEFLYRQKVITIPNASHCSFLDATTLVAEEIAAYLI